MDFGFHDDVLSLVLNIGTVFVSESIRHFKSNSTSQGGQIIEAKSVEQTVLKTLDHDVFLETATDAEIILDSYNSDNLLDSVANLESTLDNLYCKTNDFVETTTEEEIAINDNDDVLLEVNTDIDLKIDHDNFLLEDPVDDEKNICDIYENNSIDAALNDKDLFHDSGDAKPTLISREKEILLDVMELMNKIDDKNYFQLHKKMRQSFVERDKYKNIVTYRLEEGELNKKNRTSNSLLDNSTENATNIPQARKVQELRHTM
ncbi:hypothetical protein CDAR_454361 [Caerostris darwini]|uniref:Uncharacterized protein n=1 Tax=Caerostris darwini TaxID=1538125 RepID=A0AAV4V7X4_9ARAC|nr:hypothetical protein CDAR_454361 [Caerostris darwini]